MNCGIPERDIAAYSDGEMSLLRRLRFGRHLRGCAACSERRDNALGLRSRIRAEVPRFTAPAELVNRLRAMAEQMPSTAFASRRRTVPSQWRWLAGGALAGSLATIAGLLAINFAGEWRASQDLVAQAVADHVRAGLDERLIEVASSDQHTVKPWLSARLDYSPTVRDYASEGFPLVGGRLDTLQGAKVATLVYRYRLHTIDVFVRPASDPPALSVRAIRGFNVVRAGGGGMEYVGVSDVSADVLAKLVERMAAAD